MRRTYEFELTGGHPNSLGRTQEIVSEVLADRALLQPLFATLESADPVVRMRVGDALEKVCRERPEWFASELDRVFTEMATIDQPSIQWHVVQILGQLPLTRSQYRRAIKHVKGLLTTSRDWIVLNNAMQQLHVWSQDDAELAVWLVPELDRLTRDPRRSVAARAARLLAAG